MKVKYLIEQLKKLKPEQQILLANDEEGNMICEKWVFGRLKEGYVIFPLTNSAIKIED